MSPRQPLLAALTAAFVQPCAAQEGSPRLQAPAVEVIGTQPLPGLGVPRSQVPANVQSLTDEALRESRGLALPGFMGEHLPSVNVNENQGNPYQADLNYRGFTASPLLGTPQGLSVFLDGVRVNEPFGDLVSWDLIPQSALAGATLLPGSIPQFGLNTLGGALSLATKSGTTHPGLALRGEAGSFGRRLADFEYGSSRAGWSGYVNAHYFEEDGWRDFSPSLVRQLFAKGEGEAGGTALGFSLALADNDLTGNGLVPQSMFARRREQVFTVPDNTLNRATLANFSASRWLGERWLLAALVYGREVRRDTLNGDVNDEFEDDPALDGAAGAAGGAGLDQDTAVNNRTRLEQRGGGASLQLTFAGARHQASVGLAYDGGHSEFEQTSELGVFDADRAVSATGAPEVENRLDGRNTAWGLYFTDTVTLGAETHLTLAGRYNHTRVVTRDRLNPAPPNLDADFTYRKFNPALGLTHAPQPGWQLYANLSQGSRAPTPIELGCADAANPCTLPNALVSDPFLEQVVTRTVEAGLRGGGKTLNWHAGAFRSTNYDDILFVSTSTSAGFFTNFGRTRRQGLELDLGGAGGGWDWRVDYSLVDATFESPALLVSPNNSTRGIAPGAADDEIAVRPGDRIPGIPRHSLKLAVDKALAEGWRLGASLLAFSYQFVRGNENNRHQAGSFTDSSGETRSFQGPGTVPGYALLNLRASWRAARDWELFARLDNVFDKRYFTGGALAENPFDAAGDFLTNSEDWARETFLAPGAPRALWLGVRFSPDLR